MDTYLLVLVPCDGIEEGGALLVKVKADNYDQAVKIAFDQAKSGELFQTVFGIQTAKDISDDFDMDLTIGIIIDDIPLINP